MCFISFSRSSMITRRRRGDTTDRKSGWAGWVMGSPVAHGPTWSSSRFAKLTGSGPLICLFAIQLHAQHAVLGIQHKAEAYGGPVLCRPFLQSGSTS